MPSVSKRSSAHKDAHGKFFPNITRTNSSDLRIIIDLDEQQDGSLINVTIQGENGNIDSHASINGVTSYLNSSTVSRTGPTATMRTLPYITSTIPSVGLASSMSETTGLLTSVPTAGISNTNPTGMAANTDSVSVFLVIFRNLFGRR